MKRSLVEVARAFNVHPFELLLLCSELGAPFQEVWPEADSVWIDSVKAQFWSRFGKPRPPEMATERIKLRSTETLGDAARHIVTKLAKKDKWGRAGVPGDYLRQIWNDGREVDDAIDELTRRDFIIVNGKGMKGVYSLNPSRKADIEAIILPSS